MKRFLAGLALGVLLAVSALVGYVWWITLPWT